MLIYLKIIPDLVSIHNSEIHHFGRDKMLNDSTWPSVWFTKIKRSYLEKVEAKKSDAGLRLALMNCLNEIEEVS